MCEPHIGVNSTPAELCCSYSECLDCHRTLCVDAGTRDVRILFRFLGHPVHLSEADLGGAHVELLFFFSSDE